MLYMYTNYGAGTNGIVICYYIIHIWNKTVREQVYNPLYSPEICIHLILNRPWFNNKIIPGDTRWVSNTHLGQKNLQLHSTACSYFSTTKKQPPNNIHPHIHIHIKKKLFQFHKILTIWLSISMIQPDDPLKIFFRLTASFFWECEGQPNNNM